MKTNESPHETKGIVYLKMDYNLRPLLPAHCISPLVGIMNVLPNRNFALKEPLSDFLVN